MRAIAFALLFITLGIISKPINSLNILAILPFEGKSHFIGFQPYLQELVKRGHNLTVISHFPNEFNKTHYHDISLAGKSKILQNVFTIHRSYKAIIDISLFLVNTANANCRLMLSDGKVQNLVKSKAKFDVVVVEVFNTDCGLGLAYKLDAPVVGITTHMILPWHYRRLGINYNPSFVQFLFLEGGTKPNFFQRIERSIFYLYYNLLYTYFGQRIDQQIIEEYIGPVPPLEELAREVKVTLVYQSLGLTGSNLLPSNLIEVGGYHVAETKPLQDDLRKFIEDSPHGVIFISFESMLKASLTPKSLIKTIIDAVSELPQRVIWKWEEDTLPGNPKNIYSSNWLPQNDILAHPKVLAFYSHCGMMSTTEAIHHGVPVVGMPIFGDQPANAAAIEESGLGVQIQLRDVTKELLLEKFKTVLDPKLAQRARGYHKMGPVVEIEQGKLEGIKNVSDGTLIFRGIPYAKPPIGELRFSDPMPPEPWKGIRDAKKPCNVCFQMSLLVKNALMGDEDCLYLNVATPELPSKTSPLRPVLVYIHGGGFVGGVGTDYDEMNVHSNYVDRGMVVVTFNYRLGVLGFLSLDLKEAPGNMGLKDQSLALKWVKKNISKFGGNPDDVTIYGISAGAASVEYQMVSPMSIGLFNKAIAQSGSSMSPWSHSNLVKEMSRKITELKGKTFSNDNEILQYLKDLPVKDLVLAADKVVSAEKTPGGLFFGFCPCTEKPNGWQAFLEESEYELLKRGDFAKVPYLTTFNSREGLIAVRFGSNLQKLVTDINFGEFLKSYFPIDDATADEYDKKFKKVYLSLNIYPEPDAFAIEFFSDLDFFAGIYIAAKLMAKHNPSVYFMEFAYEGNLAFAKKMFGLESYKGTSHCDDVGYMVKTKDLASIQPSKADQIASQRLLTFHTNFIKYGKPTLELNDVITTQWEPVEFPNMKYLVVDKDLKMDSNPHPERMALFEELYEKYFPK